MCQAIVKPANARVNKRALAVAFAQNPDGAGFAWYDEESEMVWEQKGYWNFKAFWQAVRPHAHQNVLIHFRAATHGSICQANCHPFRVADNVVVAHNGILYSYTPLGKDERSDSRIFVEELLAPVISQAIDPVAFIATPQVQKLIKEMINSWNRLVFLTPNGFHIINEYQGDWVDGVWFSSGDPMKKTIWHQPIHSQYGFGTTSVVDLRSGGRNDRAHGKRRGRIPPIGTPAYDKYWEDLGYVRDGNAWVPKDEGTRKKIIDGKQGGLLGLGEDDEGEEIDALDGDADTRQALREGLEPANGSRPREPQEAQASVQLALGAGESGTTQGEKTAKGWEIFMEAQADLNQLSTQELGEQLSVINHNRSQITKALAIAPEGSEVQKQLMQGIRDLDERERDAVELAQGGMI